MHKGSRRNDRIENPRQLAAAFACCVTAEANDSNECVAKNSDNSLFKVLQRMLPEVGSLGSALNTLSQKLAFSLSCQTTNICCHAAFSTDHPTRGWKTPLERKDLSSRVQQGGSVRVWFRLHKNPQAKSSSVRPAQRLPIKR